LHHLFNVVTNSEGIPHAVLIRGIFPLDGVPVILARRGAKVLKKDLTTGPGKVSVALNIHKGMNGILLTGNTIWIEDRGIEFENQDVLVGPRVGVDYAGEDALLPYRFRVEWKVVEEFIHDRYRS
jgi:3-methyladenine DNA glycosylase